MSGSRKYRKVVANRTWTRRFPHRFGWTTEQRETNTFAINVEDEEEEIST